MHSAFDAIYITKGRVHSVMTRFSIYLRSANEAYPPHSILLGDRNTANTFLIALISRYIRDLTWLNRVRNQSKLLFALDRMSRGLSRSLFLRYADTLSLLMAYISPCQA